LHLIVRRSTHAWVNKTLHIFVQDLIDAKTINSSADLRSLTVLAFVKGTPPNVTDPYHIYAELLDAENKIINEIDREAVNKTKGEKWELVKVAIQFDKNMTERLKEIKVVFAGSDAENWAGNFGAAIGGEKVFLELAGDTNKSLIARFKVRTSL